MTRELHHRVLQVMPLRCYEGYETYVTTQKR